jgi:hypothetical protein
MKAKSILLILALAAPPYAAAATECVGIAALREGKSIGLYESLSNYLSGNAKDAPDCSVLVSVAKRTRSAPVKAGRRLEDAKPFDPAEAQANLEAAQRDPDTARRLARLRGEVKDETLLLYLEAAVLDEDGFYSARELRIQQLQQRLR